MVTNLLFKGIYDVEVYKDKFTLNGEINHIKEVPFLRFDLGNYGLDEAIYIEDMLGKFKNSVGICEFSLRDTLLLELATLGNILNKVGKILHIDINNNDVGNGGISADAMGILGDLVGSGYRMDRVVLHDNSTVLNPVTISMLKKQVANKLGLKGEDNVGLCSSPFSFDSNSCLTAEIARDLISIYGFDKKVQIPSANHQSMDSCSCIRHFEITNDTYYIGKKTKKDSSPNFDTLEDSSNLIKEGYEGGKKDKQVGKSKQVKKRISKAPIEWE